MPVAQFEMILQTCAGNAEFASILPVLVLKGFAGVRGCELVGQTVGQTDVVMWSDFELGRWFVEYPRGSCQTHHSQVGGSAVCSFM